MPFLFFIVDTLPFLITVVLLAFVIFVFRKVASYMWIGRDTNNPFFMSVMAATYALSTWVYFNKIYPGSTPSVR